MHAAHTQAGESRECCTYLRACWSSLAAFSGPLALFLILNSLNLFFSPSVSASLSAAPSRLASLLENKPFRDFLDELFFAISAGLGGVGVGWGGETRVGDLQLMEEELQRKSELARTALADR